MPRQNFIQKLISAILTITVFFFSFGWGLSPQQNFLRAPGGLAADEKTSNSLTNCELDDFLFSPEVQRFLSHSDHKEGLQQNMAVILKDQIKAQQIIPVLHKEKKIRDVSKYLGNEETKFKTALVIAFACSDQPTISIKRAAEFLDVEEEEIDNIRKWLSLGEQGSGKIAKKALQVCELWQKLFDGTNNSSGLTIADEDREKKQQLLNNGQYLIAHFLLENISLDETIELTGLSELEIKLIENENSNKYTNLPKIIQWFEEKLQERKKLEEKFRSEKIKLPGLKIEEYLDSIFKKHLLALKKIDQQTVEYVQAIINHRTFGRTNFFKIQEAIREELDIKNIELTAAILTLYLFGGYVDKKDVENYCGFTAERLKQIEFRIRFSQFAKDKKLTKPGRLPSTSKINQFKTALITSAKSL
ncbi:MAG: hypothetical protein ABII74_10480 [Elusimicrobiota bacterium]